MIPRGATAAGTLARAKANGYKKEDHVEQDRVEDGRRHNDTTRRNHKRCSGAVCVLVAGIWTAIALAVDCLCPARRVCVLSVWAAVHNYLIWPLQDFIHSYIHTSQP